MVGWGTVVMCSAASLLVGMIVGYFTAALMCASAAADRREDYPVGR